MKKTVSVILALCTLFCLLVLPASAKGEDEVIRLRLHSDVAGCMESDVDEIIEIVSGPVRFYEANGCPVSIADYAGGTEYAHMEAGRSYAITYTLTAADGFTLPETLSDGDVEFECGKGVTVVYCKSVNMYVPASGTGTGEDGSVRVLRIVATVVVDGNAFQRIIGWLRDLILKIRSWSLY